MRRAGLAEVVENFRSFEGDERGRLLSRILRNSGSVIISRGLMGLLKILALLYVARYLGSSEFGRLSIVLALLEIFRVLSDFGIETVVIRTLAREGPEAEQEVMGSSMALKFGLACLAYLGFILVAKGVYHEQGIGTLSTIAGLGLLAWALSSGLASSFQAKLRMPDVVPAQLAGGVVSVAGLTIGASWNWPLTLLVGVLPCAELVTLVLSVALYRRSVKAGLIARHCRLRPRLRTIGAVLSLAWPVGLTSLFVMAYFRLDTLLLGWLMGETAIGQYAVAYRITEPFLLLPSAISVSLYSAAATQWDKKGQETMRLYLTSLVCAICYAAIVALSLALLAPSILILISPAYLEAATALRVLSWSLIFMSGNLMSTAILYAMGRYRFLMFGGAAMLLANLGLNLFLIPRFGILGASVATVITEALNFLIQTGYISTQRRAELEGGLCP